MAPAVPDPFGWFSADRSGARRGLGAREGEIMVLTSIPTTRKPIASRALSRLPVAQPDPTRIAVLLNRNARRVSDGLARRMERIVGGDNFFYSKSLEEAESFAREIVQRGYGTVVCGGGDGTLCRSVNLIHRYVEEANQWR